MQKVGVFLLVCGVSQAINPKYFHEASFSYHLDKTYGVKTLPHATLRKELHALLEQMQHIASGFYAMPIIISGCMIGANLGEKPLPWDTDCDIAFLEPDFQKLRAIETLNYSFRINPYWKTRTNDPNNLIDGRLISKKTGVFLDITALVHNSKTTVCHKNNCHDPFPLNRLLPLQPITFWGIDGYYVANDIEYLIRFEYPKGLRHTYCLKGNLWNYNPETKNWAQKSQKC